MDVEIEKERIAKSPTLKEGGLGFSQSQHEGPSGSLPPIVCLAASVHSTTVEQPQDRIRAAVTTLLPDTVPPHVNHGTCPTPQSHR